jgi:hypothetical protein
MGPERVMKKKMKACKKADCTDLLFTLPFWFSQNTIQKGRAYVKPSSAVSQFRSKRRRQRKAAYPGGLNVLVLIGNQQFSQNKAALRGK